MKKIITLFAIALVGISCQNKNESQPVVAEIKPTENYAVFGDSISSEGAISNAEMLEKFDNLKEGDTTEVTFKSTINEVCQKKGCWMNVALNENNSTFIKFKDYAFFVPMNADKKEVIVKGKAYVSIESIADLKHYAKDAGKSQEAIDSIVAPEKTYSFMADGVLIAK
uniref:DUF4920 domain-containing protein n=1 Tax=Flavobacterium sp. TaxID=239 RepID=UPI00404A52A4